MCSAEFFSSTSYGGNEKIFNAAVAEPNLGQVYYKSDNKDDMKDDVESIKTFDSTWLIIFDDTNYNGNFFKIEPNKSLDDLETYSRGEGDDWKNQIQSFLMYDYEPPFWNSDYPRPSIDLPLFSSLFPDSTTQIKYAGEATEYITQDSTYRIYDPTYSSQTLTSTTYYVHLDHENPAADDDHVEFLAVFDNNGNLTDVLNFSWTAGGAFNITSQAVSAVEDIVNLAGDLLDVVTDGVSTEVADAFDTVFSIGCKIFNLVCSEIYKYTDNGGRFYFLPVVCHTINRLTCSVTVK